MQSADHWLFPRPIETDDFSVRTIVILESENVITEPPSRWRVGNRKTPIYCANDGWSKVSGVSGPPFGSGLDL